MGCRLLACLLLLAACSPVAGPRQADPTIETGSLIDTVPTFDSPRVIHVVEAEPDIGAVTFRGVVEGRDPVIVVAPADGRVLNVAFETGESVMAGVAVLDFLPAPTEAELIELEIAQLRIDQAEAAGQSTQETERELAKLVATYDARIVTIEAPTDGVISGARTNVAYSVTDGQPLFELADPDDVVVVARLGRTQAEDVALGTGATIAVADSDADTPDLLAGRVISVSTEDQTATIQLAESNTIEVDDRLSVSLQVSAVDGATWLPLDAVGRQAGSPYLLIETGSGQLQRRTVSLGQRTLTHVEVLADLAPGTKVALP